MLKHLSYLLGAFAFTALISLSSCEWQGEPQPTKITQVTPPSDCNLCEFKEYPK